MTVERYGSKTDVVVKLILVFFIALLSFSIGTFVGKKFSDNQHKLAQLESGEHDATATAEEHSEDEHGENRGVASVPPEAGHIKPDKALSEDEIAKLAEEFVTDDEKEDIAAHGGHAEKNEHKPASTTAPATTAPAAAHAPSVHQQDVLKPAARMTEGAPPVVENPTPVTSRIPSALPKEVASSAVGKFTVQVGSYQSEKEAQSVSADLKGKGFSAFYVSANVKGSTWFRVGVGLFTTAKEADAYKKDLLARSKVGSAIVQKIQ